MREAVKRLGGDTSKVNPLSPVDLVIDHSVTVDHFGDDDAFEENVRLEMERNHRRYMFLKWESRHSAVSAWYRPAPAFAIRLTRNTGKAVWSELQDGEWIAYPDSLVGTDSHTTMINGLGVWGWGVGGIEAEAAMLGQPVSMLIPDVVGFKLTGKLREGSPPLTRCSPSRKCCVSMASWVNLLNFMVMVWIRCRWRIARPSLICRRNMAPPVVSSPLTPSPGIYAIKRA